MFEKESQDYAIREVAPRQELYIKGRADIDADYEKVKKIWQDGAEFGYNKANEWHYVKDGDLPECEEYVWCLFKNAQFPFIAKLYFGMADNDFHWKCLTTNEEYYECEVYAWKEIVLPKESE